jgi:hypothetical protein
LFIILATSVPEWLGWDGGSFNSLYFYDFSGKKGKGCYSKNTNLSHFWENQRGFKSYFWEVSAE